MVRVSLLPILMLCFQSIYGEIQIENELEKMDSDIGTLKSENEMLKKLLEDVLARLNKVPVDEPTVEAKVDTKVEAEVEQKADSRTGLTLSDIEPKDEKLNSPKMQKEELIARIMHLEREWEIIQRYVNAEEGLDAYLESVPKDVHNAFKETMEKTKELIAGMKSDVKLSIESVDVELQNVDMSAKSRNVVIAGVLYYGGIGSGCARGNDDCKLPGSECREGVCRCDAGLSYDSLGQACVKTCNSYGTIYQAVPYHIIRGFNNATLNETTLEECKQMCNSDAGGDFVCRSFDYFPRWESCFLSEYVKADVAEEYWQYNSAGTHYQRDCSAVN